MEIRRDFRFEKTYRANNLIFQSKNWRPKMQNSTQHLPPVYLRTPLIESIPLRPYTAGRRVYLKLENCQPSGSFKLRGVSEQVKAAKQSGAQRIVISSGGNAGLAAAYSALVLDMAVHIVIPRRTPALIVDQMKALGTFVTVERFGDSAQEVYDRAEEISKLNGHALIHPSDHPLLYQGHSTMVDEIAEDLGPGVVPSLIVASCGGGGLVCGLVDGIRRLGWANRTKILVMETTGTGSFNAMVSHKTGKDRGGPKIAGFAICKLDVKAGGERVKLDSVDSIVTSLSVAQVNQRAVDVWREAEPPLISRIATDKNAISACINFANDHRFLVGAACGTTLAAFYERIVERVLKHDEDPHETIFDRVAHEELRTSNDGPVVVIVCGGAEISLEMLAEFRRQFGV